MQNEFSSGSRRPLVRQCSRVTPRRSQLRQAARAAKTSDGPSIAVVGVTGAVGQEFLRVRLSTAREQSSSRLAPTLQSHGRARPHSSIPAAVLTFRYALFMKACAYEAIGSIALIVLQVLKERDFPYSNIKLLASARCGLILTGYPLFALIKLLIH